MPAYVSFIKLKQAKTLSSDITTIPVFNSVTFVSSYLEKLEDSGFEYQVLEYGTNTIQLLVYPALSTPNPTNSHIDIIIWKEVIIPS